MTQEKALEMLKGAADRYAAKHGLDYKTSANAQEQVLRGLFRMAAQKRGMDEKAWEIANDAGFAGLMWKRAELQARETNGRALTEKQMSAAFESLASWWTRNVI